MVKRKDTRPVHVGNIQLGGQEKILIQSMCSIKTSRTDLVVEQLRKCHELGADLMRLSVLDEEDAKAFSILKKEVSIPLIADIHFDYRLALCAIENGADAIRVNPGNIGSKERIWQVATKCASKRIPIRIGVNSGSLKKDANSNKPRPASAIQLMDDLSECVAIFEEVGFHDLVLSAKGSNVLETVEAYKEASKRFPYPLHLGITEAGPKDIGLIRSTAGLAPLLMEGIGDTIRISLSDAPEEEIRACCRLLHDLGLKPDYPTFISCPTCGRTQVNLIPTAKALQSYMEENHINKTVAVMGCVVNGPGEAKHADLGCAGGKGHWVIFQKGKILKEVKDGEIIPAMIEELKKL